MEKPMTFKLISSGIYEVWISKDEKYKQDTFVTADTVVKLLNEGRAIAIMDANGDQIY
jgi:hypothetical protein